MIKMEPWKTKAHKIIYSLCQQSYLKANRLNLGHLKAYDSRTKTFKVKI